MMINRKKKLNKLFSLLLIAILCIGAFAPIGTYAPTGHDGDTNYAPISSGDYGWRTFGVRASGYINGHLHQFGDYVIDTHLEGPAILSTWVNWENDYKAEKDRLLKAVAKAAQYEYDVNHFEANEGTLNVEVKLDYYGVLTHKTDNNVDYYYYADPGSSTKTLHWSNNAPFEDPGIPKDFSSLDSVASIVSEGYKSVYDAYVTEILHKTPNPSQSMAWDHDQSFYNKWGTVNITVYATRIAFWATSNYEADALAETEKYDSWRVKRWYDPAEMKNAERVTVKYYWEGTNLPNTKEEILNIYKAAGWSEQGAFALDERTNGQGGKEPTLSKWYERNVGVLDGLAADWKSSRYSVLAYYRPKAVSIPVEIVYISVGDKTDNGINKGYSALTISDYAQIKGGEEFKYTADSSITGSDGKIYKVVSDSEAGSYPSAFAYGATTSGTYRNYLSANTQLSLSRSGNRFSVMLPDDLTGAKKARLYIPVLYESDSNEVEVKYVNENGIELNPSPAQIYPITKGQQKEITSNPPSGTSLDKSRTPQYQKQSGGNKADGTWVGDNVRFTPARAENYYLYIPVKTDSSSSIVTVIYVDEDDNKITPSPQQTYPITKGSEKTVQSYPPTGKVVDKSRTPIYERKSTGNTGNGTWSGNNVRFTPRGAGDYYLYIPVKDGEGGGGPTPSPTPGPTPAPDPGDSPGSIGSGVLASTSLSSSGYFWNPTYGQALYMPSGLSVNGTITAPQYYFYATYNTVAGASKSYPMTFTWTYSVEIPAEDGGGDPADPSAPTPTPTLEPRSGSQTVYVTRNYSYSYLSSSYQYAWLNRATMDNSALTSTLQASYTGAQKSLTYTSYGSSESSHIIEPTYSSSVSLGDFGKQYDGFVPGNASESYANSLIPQIRVRNDRLVFNGSTVMSDSWTEQNAPSVGSFPQAPNVQFTGTNSIPTERANGLNNSNPSSGVVYYRGISGGDKTTYFTPNSITVHTPVYIAATITCDNNKYVQAPALPSTEFTLVNGHSTSYGSTNKENDTADFQVNITNSGQHITKQGYGNNNYTSFVLSGGNQIAFTCDMWLDVSSDSNIANDILIPANTWYSCGTGNKRYYLPMWVADGEYTVTYRSIAYNGNGSSPTQTTANTTITNYIGYSSKKFTVVGKMYDFTFTDVNSNVDWEDVFRVGTTLKINYPSKYTDGTLSVPNYNAFNKKLMYYYTSGLKNELGLNTGRTNKFILPLIAGSSPKTVNGGVLKAGYTWKFKLSTTGSTMASAGSKVVIKPSFYWVSEDGATREQVNIYYTEKWDGKNHSVVQVGGTVDATNVKYEYANSDALGIPQTELEDTADIFGKTALEWGGQRAGLYVYGTILSNRIFKTYSNQKYAAKILGGSQKTPAGAAVTSYLSGKGIGEKTLKTSKQTFYFEYSLPSVFHAVSTSFNMAAYVADHPTVDYTEAFWKKGGYIVIHFDIDGYDASDNRVLSYGTGANNMWNIEGFTANRTDYYGKSFTFQPGDVFMIYTDKTAADDYIAVQK